MLLLQQHFTVKRDIDLIELLKVLAAAAAAIYVKVILDRNLDARKFVRDLLLELTKKASEQADSIDASVQASTGRPWGDEDARKLVGQFSVLGNSLHLLNELMAKVEVRSRVRGADVIAAYQDLKKAVTGTNFPTGPIAPGSQRQANGAHRKLRACLNEITVDVARNS